MLYLKDTINNKRRASQRCNTYICHYVRNERPAQLFELCKWRNKNKPAKISIYTPASHRRSNCAFVFTLYTSFGTAGVFQFRTCWERTAPLLMVAVLATHHKKKCFAVAGGDGGGFWISVCVGTRRSGAYKNETKQSCTTSLRLAIRRASSDQLSPPYSSVLDKKLRCI